MSPSTYFFFFAVSQLLQPILCIDGMSFTVPRLCHHFNYEHRRRYSDQQRGNREERRIKEESFKCAFLHLLHIDYKNTHSTSKLRIFLRSGVTLSGTTKDSLKIWFRSSGQTWFQLRGLVEVDMVRVLANVLCL